jgi:hypothetical protein
MAADESPRQLAPLIAVVAAALVLIAALAAITLLVLRDGGDNSSDLAPNEVARVDTVGPITKRTFNHWYAVIARTQRAGKGATSAQPPEVNSPAGRQLKAQVMEFLIASDWLEGEAKKRGVVVGDGEVLRLFRRTKRESFPKPAAYRQFLRKSGQTEQDILSRVRLQGLTAKVRADVTGSASDPQQKQQQLDAYQRDFKDQWRPRTHCAPGYLVPSCGNG